MQREAGSIPGSILMVVMVSIIIAVIITDACLPMCILSLPSTVASRVDLTPRGTSCSGGGGGGEVATTASWHQACNVPTPPHAGLLGQPYYSRNKQMIIVCSLQKDLAIH